MKNFKRILALVIAVIMVVGTTAGLSAAGSKWYSEAVSFIEGNGIAIIGSHADDKLTRNEFVLWVAKLESHQLSDSAWNDEVATTSFTDVTEEHHRAAIAYSANRGFIIGNGDGTFSPDKYVTFAEACAVIVRLMGYENRVDDTSDENWKYNYMEVANTYAHAIDDVFLRETDTYNPDYELSYAEAAYLLATIMNFNKTPADSDYSETSDGINLGEWFDLNQGTGVVGKAYYIAEINRVTTGLSNSSPLANGNQQTNRYTNEIDTAQNVVLYAVDGSGVLNVNGADFLRLLRVSLGLEPERDIANEEPEINVFSYVDVGSLVNVVVDRSTKEVSSLNVSENSVIVDTYLQATSANTAADFGNGTNGPTSLYTIKAEDVVKYLGWTIKSGANGTSVSYKPVLPSSYDASTMVTSWTNVVRNADGEVTSAVLNFQGETYRVSTTSSEIDIFVMEDGEPRSLTPNEAVTQLINAAQGEALIIFNDVDGDGRYDSASVKESSPFLYTSVINTNGTSTTKQDYYSSVSNGIAVGNDMVKGNQIGTVIYNKRVTNGGNVADNYFNTDPYNLTNYATGKLQLVLVASNKHYIIDGTYDQYDLVLPYYTVVDLAAFNTGIIEDVDAFSLEGYYIARIVMTDGTTKTVYIPETPAETATLPVTVGGATAEYTFNTSGWCSFLTDAKDAVIEEGIVSGVEDPGFRQATAAWMAGKYVQFVTDNDGRIIFMLGTDSSSGVSGFVTGVQKTETGDNTYNVSIATSGSSAGVNPTANYLEAALDVNSGEYRITTEYTMGGSSSVAPTVGKLHVLNTSGIWYFQDAGGNVWMNYGYNQSRRLVTADSSNSPHATTVGLLNEAINSEIYNATANRSQNKVAAWSVDENGIVHDANGDAVIYQYVENAHGGVNGVSTYEVRANASSMFDWENYEVYNAIFAGELGNPYAMNDGKINPGEDLIYVTVMQDAGSLKYLKYGDQLNWTGSSAGRYATDAYYEVEASGSGTNLMRLWTSRISVKSSPQASWFDIDGEYIINIEEIEGSRITADDGSSYTAEYTALVGFGPYYERTATAKGYTYVLKFTRVVEYTSVDGTATAVIDKAQTLMIPLYKGESGTQSEQVQAITEEDFEKYTIANGYYIDDVTHLVYLLVDDAEIVYKRDENGNIVYSDVVYDWESGVVATEYTSGDEVLFDTYDINRYTTFSYTAKDSSEDGWFPGAMYVNLDGKTYEAVNTMPVIIVTPSADGFEITTTTLANVPSEGLFATTWNGVENNGELVAIAIIGDVTGADEVVVPSDDTTLVYLDSSAKAIVRAGEFSANWLVVSDRSAYALPSGEEIGVIYREYSTYEDAQKAASIDLTVVGGHWYKVDQNGKIVSDATEVVYEEFDGVVIDTNDYTQNGDIYSSSFYFVDGEYRIANLVYTNGVLTGITAGDVFVPTVDVSSLSATEYLIPTTGVSIYERADGRYFYKNASGQYVLVTVDGSELTDGVAINVYNLAWAIDQAPTADNRATYRVEIESADQVIYKYTSVTGDFYFIETIDETNPEAPTSKYYKVNLTETDEEGKVVMEVTAEEVDVSSLEPFKITSATYSVITVNNVNVYTMGGISFIDATPTVSGDSNYVQVTVTPIEGAADGAPNAIITEGAAVTMDAIVAGLEPVMEIGDAPLTEQVEVVDYYGTLYMMTKEAEGENPAEYHLITLTEYTFNGKTYNVITVGEAIDLDEEGIDYTWGEHYNVEVIASYETITVYTEQVRKDANGAYSFTKTDGTAISGAPAIEYNIADFSLVSGNAINGAYRNGTTYIVAINGEYYPADSNYRRVESSTVVTGLKQGTITSADAAGNTYATINGVKNVNVTNYNFAFFYRNADGTVLYKAGDSTDVTVASRAIYEAQIQTQQTAYDNAVAAYQEALSKDYLSEERLAYYREEVERTEAELLEAKNSLLDRYFNGRFWGVPNSPYYTYVLLGQGTFQQPTSSLTFNYVLVGDTYCVFSDEFILG